VTGLWERRRANISGISRAIAPQFAALRWTSSSYSASVKKSHLALLPLALASSVMAARAGEPAAIDEPLAQQVRTLALDGARAGLSPRARVEVTVGSLDPRLHLAPCQRIEPHLPNGARLWGKSRIGLRCTQGPVAWNVYLPITVKVFAPSLIAAAPLPAGTVLTAADLRESEVDLAEEPGTAIGQGTLAVGRTLARPLAAGQALRQSDLKTRQWFAAGDTVSLVAVGPGYTVSGEGQALTPGIEGQVVRVRTENGRVVTGQAVAEHRVEVPL
jgi:flagella basal body P-ring formation protein FlgA